MEIVGGMKWKNILFPLLLLIVVVTSRKSIFNLRIVHAVDPLTIFSSGLVHVPMDPEEVMPVGADLDPCGIMGDASCFGRFLEPGKCDQCFKNHGFPRGKCQALTCFCCKE